MIISFLMLAAVAQNSPSAITSEHRQLAERFVSVTTPDRMPSLEPGLELLTEALVQGNPAREADVRQIAKDMFNCLSVDGKPQMREAAVQAALALDVERLEQLVAFVEIERAQAPSSLPPAWDAARKDYGRWMYSIPSQPAAVALAQKCSEKMAASMAAKGIRD